MMQALYDLRDKPLANVNQLAELLTKVHARVPDARFGDVEDAAARLENLSRR
jgi:hypothetical protein